MSYPSPILRERVADAVLHFIGVAGAVVACVLLVLFAARNAQAADIAAVSIYGAILIIGFSVSAAYHLWPWHGARRWLRRIDHASIFLKIAATYTPLAVLVGTGFAYAVLAVVWGIALAGAGLRLSVWRLGEKGMIWAFLALGWFSLVLIWPISQTVPLASLILIVCGGLLYSLGAVIYGRSLVPYLNAVWHSFVLGATACFAVAIGLGVSA